MRPRALTRGMPMLALLPALALGMVAAGSHLTGRQLIAALQQGGYVILMRHASSPGLILDPRQAEPDNSKHERQLDAAGKASARAMGDAFRDLRIPLGDVLSSPTYRALATARLAQFPTPKTFEELGDAWQSMNSDAFGSHGAWLRSQVGQPPQPGTNTVIITHYPNISEAFGSDAKNLAEGEALVYRPTGRGSAALVGRVKIQDWPRLSSAPQKSAH